MPDVSSLTPLGAVLEQEDNRATLEKELNRYRSALTLDRNTLHFIRLHFQAGLSEDYLRNIFIDVFSRRKREIAINEVVNINSLSKDRGLIINLFGSIIRAQVIYRDEDDEDILKILDEGTDIPILDLLGEKVRIQTERVDLLGMQVAFLKDEERRAKKEKQKRARMATLPADTPEEFQGPVLVETNADIKTSPFLEPWQVFWTTRFFSAEQNHLVPLECASRTSVAEEVQRLGQGQISIRPQSILSALEFHLRKDVMQRALSMRNKYGSEGIKDWVKIKRGSDRIFILISEGFKNRLIFFAAGRDIIYRRN